MGNSGTKKPAYSVLSDTINKITDSAEALSDIVREISGTEEPKQKARTASRQQKNTPAKNTEEFILKYCKKRFTPANAGKAYLLSFLLDAYSMSERGVQTTLWDVGYLRSKVQAEEDVRSFDAYYHLTEWLRNLYENSRTMRNALQSVLSDFYHTTTSIIAAENIRKCVVPVPITDKLQALDGDDFNKEIRNNPDTLLTLWLNTISLEAYTPQKDGGLLMRALRENIREGLRYIIAYHTFLDVIAEFTGIPECAYLKVKSAPLEESLSNLNKALELLRDNVKEYREPEITASAASRPEDFHFTGVDLEPKLDSLLPASLTFWTPKYLQATMKYFEPVGEEPPVPAEKVQFLRDSIRRDFKREYINWYVLYTRYSISYRIPEPATTPPTGRKSERISVKVEAQAEEGK